MAPLDNAVAESIVAALKVEHFDRLDYRTRAHARMSIFTWIHRYNAAPH